MLAKQWDHELAAKVAANVHRVGGGLAPTVVRMIIRETLHRIVESDVQDVLETMSLHCRLHTGLKANTFEWAAELIRAARAACDRCVQNLRASS